jgi:hypothetical protein
VAAGWEFVGETVGRSRDDRWNRMVVARKALFLKPLLRDWRHRLGVADVAEVQP